MLAPPLEERVDAVGAREDETDCLGVLARFRGVVEGVRPGASPVSCVSERVCVKFSRVASYQASEHDAKHGNVNPALLTFRQVFIVLAQAT